MAGTEREQVLFFRCWIHAILACTLQNIWLLNANLFQILPKELLEKKSHYQEHEIRVIHFNSLIYHVLSMTHDFPLFVYFIHNKWPKIYSPILRIRTLFWTNKAHARLHRLNGKEISFLRKKGEGNSFI